MSDFPGRTDLRLLDLLQRDATLSVDALAERVSLSRNACWRRVKRLEQEGLIARRVALVDPDKVGLGLQVLVQIRTTSHEPGWLERFDAAVRDFPEILGAYRLAGDLDYLLRVRVPDVPGYDRFYRRLIAAVPLGDVSASFVMESLKETTALPLLESSLRQGSPS